MVGTGHSSTPDVTCPPSFRGDRVDHRPDARYLVRGKPALLGVLAHGRLVGRDVYAIDLVVGDIAVDPLDLRAHGLQDAAGLLGDALELGLRQLAGAGQVTLDDELGHGVSPRWWG